MQEQFNFPNFGLSDKLGVVVLYLNNSYQIEALVNPLSLQEKTVTVSAQKSFEFYINLRDSMNNLRNYYSEGLPTGFISQTDLENTRTYLELCLESPTKK